MALNDLDFELSGTQYHIVKLNPFAGFKLLEKIRREASGVLRNHDIAALLGKDMRDTDDLVVIGSELITALLEFDPPFIEEIMNALFEHVTFANDAAVTPQKLRGGEELAFREPTDPYEVLARCLIVNFGSSFASRVQRFLQDLSVSLPSSLS